jgi:hypothetical protein
MRSLIDSRVLLLACGILAGCGGNAGGKLAVSGAVSIKGQPIDEGTINFSPKDNGPGSFAGALIKYGKYSIPAEQGLLPGAYAVRISAPEKQAAKVEEAPGQAGPVAKDRVPPQYNVNSKLEFEVKAGANNQFNFDVP